MTGSVLTAAQGRLFRVLEAQRLNDGWTPFPDVLAALVAADGFGDDLEPADVTAALYALQRAGLVEKSPTKSRNEWRTVEDDRAPAYIEGSLGTTTDKGAARTRSLNQKITEMKDAPMKLSRRKPSPVPTLTAAQIEAERLKLGEAFYGPGHAARAAVGEDPVLVERLDRAMADGLEIDLSEVPRYRRGAEVESALLEWEKARKDGPCQFCGCATARRGRSIQSALTPTEDPGWNAWRGDTACQWCRDVLGEHGDDGLRGLVFRAAASIRSGSMSSRYELAPWAPWWSELTLEQQQRAREKGKGAPWAHINTADARALAVDLLTAPSEFARTTGAVQHASIPGLPAREWTLEDLPKPGPIKLVPLGPNGQALARETADWAESRARRLGHRVGS